MHRTYDAWKSTEPTFECDEPESSYGDYDPCVTMLDGYGRCPKCQTDWSASVGLFHCLNQRCSEGE